MNVQTLLRQNPRETHRFSVRRQPRSVTAGRGVSHAVRCPMRPSARRRSGPARGLLRLVAGQHNPGRPHGSLEVNGLVCRRRVLPINGVYGPPAPRAPADYRHRWSTGCLPAVAEGPWHSAKAGAPHCAVLPPSDRTCGAARADLTVLATVLPVGGCARRADPRSCRRTDAVAPSSDRLTPPASGGSPARA
jgi:hypothetical protein